MKSRYKGVYERRIDKAIEDNVNLIEINWINISVRESASGGADRITTKLIEAEYRPDGTSVIESKRKAYESGQTVEGKYIRLPQETWTKK